MCVKALNLLSYNHVCVQVEMSVSRPLTPPPKTSTQPNVGQTLDYELLSFMLQNFLPLVYEEEERCRLMENILSMARNDNDLKVC